VSSRAEPTRPDAWRPGSQAERTALAWVRTSISIFVSAGAAARVAALDDLLLLEGVAVLGACAGVLSITMWWRRFSRAAESPGLGSERIIASANSVVAAVVAVLAVCSVGVVASSLALWALVR
jgi:uncharacterized membrane protein YidH (DUF202 family)